MSKNRDARQRIRTDNLLKAPLLIIILSIAIACSNEGSISPTASPAKANATTLQEPPHLPTTQTPTAASQTPSPTYTPLHTYAPTPTYTPPPVQTPTRIPTQSITPRTTPTPSYSQSELAEAHRSYAEIQEQEIISQIADILVTRQGIDSHDVENDVTFTIGSVEKIVEISPGAFAVFTRIHAVYAPTDDNRRAFRCRLVTISDETDDAVYPFGTIQGAMYCDDF